MTKIPVGKTIAYAYAFTFGNLGAIIGLIWIPMLIVTLIGFFAQSTYIDAMITYEATKSSAALGPGFMWMLLFVFSALLGNAMMLVPVMQQALGTRQGHVLYHFSLAQPEWRMFGAYLALLGIALAVAIAVTIVNGVIAGVVRMVPQGGPVLALAATLAMFVVLVGCAVAVARLAFLIPAVTLLEEKIDLARCWNLLRGNVLRVVVIILSILIPMGLLYLTIEIAMFGPDDVLRSFAPPTAATPSIEELRDARQRMPFTEALGFLIAPLTVGLNAGAVAAAYRALMLPPTGVAASEP